MANHDPIDGKDIRHGCVDCMYYKCESTREPCCSCYRWDQWIYKLWTEVDLSEYEKLTDYGLTNHICSNMKGDCVHCVLKGRCTNRYYTKEIREMAIKELTNMKEDKLMKVNKQNAAEAEITNPVIQEPDPTEGTLPGAKEKAPGSIKKVKAPKKTLTVKQEYFLRQLKSSQCNTITHGVSSWDIEDLAIELESVMSMMSMGAMITTLSQKGAIIKESHFISTTELGQELMKTL